MELCWAHESKAEANQRANVKSRIQRNAHWCRAVNLFSDLMFIASTRWGARQLEAHSMLVLSRLSQAGAPILKCVL